jgi:malonyl-CoA O-methyltransferase
MNSRLDYVKIQPKLILDMGCGTGLESQNLKNRYPQAIVCGLDSAFNFLTYGMTQRGEGINWVCAQASQLPLKEYSVDLIFANMLLPWCIDLPALFQSWQKLLKPEGLLMFSTLGPDTLQELKTKTDVKHWIDMHDIGDHLTQAGFLDPVIDMEHLTLSYTTSTALLDELMLTGFLPKSFLAIDLTPNANHHFPLTYEMIYGHAWGAGPRQRVDEEGLVRIPISAIKRF